ncbi:MAG: polysulfide reductase NrfD [Pirellulales bacterium]|nr:polysulfide reductase NrfD [Pirellulales bacterium]
MQVKFQTIEGKSLQFYLLVAALALLIVPGLYSTWRMYEDGIYLSGMTNRIPWGLQIILCVFYIGASAGSLVISSLYGIFGKIEYKPFARIAVYLALLFLIAALLSILTDLGRLDNLTASASYFNFLSMLSINPFLYNTYILICIVYLWAMLREKERFVRVIAVVAVVWAVLVHSGTGAIFGFVPRELYQSPLLPPSFITAALSSGTALMILVILGLFRLNRRPLDHELVVRLGRLLAVFIVIVLYFLFVENAYRLYMADSREAACHFLFTPFNGTLFWGGLIVVGCIIPAVVLFHPRTGKSTPWIVFSCVLTVFGVLCERYLIVIPGQTHPPELLPNMEITSITELGAKYCLNEGIVHYTASIHEVFQAVSVLALIGFMFVVGLRLFKLMPTEAKIYK